MRLDIAKTLRFLALAALAAGLAACDNRRQESTQPGDAAEPSQSPEVSPLVIAPDREPPEVSVAQSYVEEIDGLAEQAPVAAAMEQIEARTEQALGLLIELTEIPAPPFQEEARGRRIAELMREIGYEDVTTDEVGNVIASRPGRVGERTVAMAAHIDTVFPPETDVTVRREGERLYAPGIGDNTRGVVALLEIMRAVHDQEIETDANLMFVANVGEEGLGDLEGVKHLFREGGPRIDAFIAIDGGDQARIVQAAVGSHRYRVTYQGPGGHSWGAFGLANPHHALGRAIALFDAEAPAVSATEVKTSFNIGRIGGGTSVNSIPFESWMEVDMRSSRQHKIDEMDAVFQSAVQRALEAENAGRASGPALTVDVDMVGRRPAGETDPRSPLVQRAVAAVERYGFEPRLVASSTDSNIPMSLDVPAITISRGGLGDNAHSPDEWWQDKDSHIGPQVGLLILLSSAGSNE